MSTKTIVGIVVIVLTVTGALIFLQPKPAIAPVTQQTTASTSAEASAAVSGTVPAATGSTASVPTATPGGAMVAPLTVTYTDKGFSPANLNVAVGQEVRFVNNSSHGMWVAVGDHPTHTTYDGTSKSEHCVNNAPTNGVFDECAVASSGQTWAFTFQKAGTFTFHNHVNASDTGTVTIKPLSPIQ